MRVFFAIDIEPANKLKVSNYIDELKQFNADVKWVEKQNIHLTVKFIGEVSPAQFKSLAEAAREGLAAVNVGEVAFSGLGVFPKWEQAKVLWLGVNKGKGFLTKVFTELENALSKVGFAREGKRFSPHLTIGRVRSQRNLDKLLLQLKHTEDFPSFEGMVHEVTIFKSELTPSGPIYSVLDKIKLKENL